MSFSDYLEIKLLDDLFGNAAYAPPATLYVALSVADPTEDGSGVSEPVGNGYARVPSTSIDWNAAVAGAINNSAVLSFPQATGPWGNCTHFAIFDAAVAGNMLAYGILTLAKSFNNGDTASFAAAAFTVTLD